MTALGGLLEFYDFIIFVFFTTVIGRLFFPPNLPDWQAGGQSGAIAAIPGSGRLISSKRHEAHERTTSRGS